MIILNLKQTRHTARASLIWTRTPPAGHVTTEGHPVGCPATRKYKCAIICCTVDSFYWFQLLLLALTVDADESDSHSAAFTSAVYWLFSYMFVLGIFLERPFKTWLLITDFRISVCCVVISCQTDKRDRKILCATESQRKTQVFPPMNVALVWLWEGKMHNHRIKISICQWIMLKDSINNVDTYSYIYIYLHIYIYTWTHTPTHIHTPPDRVNRPLQNIILKLQHLIHVQISSQQSLDMHPSARNKHKMSTFAPPIQLTASLHFESQVQKADQMWR